MSETKHSVNNDNVVTLTEKGFRAIRKSSRASFNVGMPMWKTIGGRVVNFAPYFNNVELAVIPRGVNVMYKRRASDTICVAYAGEFGSASYATEVATDDETDCRGRRCLRRMALARLFYEPWVKTIENPSGLIQRCHETSQSTGQKPTTVWIRWVAKRAMRDGIYLSRHRPIKSKAFTRADTEVEFHVHVTDGDDCDDLCVETGHTGSASKRAGRGFLEMLTMLAAQKGRRVQHRPLSTTTTSSAV